MDWLFLYHWIDFLNVKMLKSNKKYHKNNFGIHSFYSLHATPTGHPRPQRLSTCCICRRCRDISLSQTYWHLQVGFHSCFSDLKNSVYHNFLNPFFDKQTSWSVQSCFINKGITNIRRKPGKLWHLVLQRGRFYTVTTKLLPCLPYFLTANFQDRKKNSDYWPEKKCIFHTSPNYGFIGLAAIIF